MKNVLCIFNTQYGTNDVPGFKYLAFLNTAFIPHKGFQRSCFVDEREKVIHNNFIETG